jgi:hypothetical protein
MHEDPGKRKFVSIFQSFYRRALLAVFSFWVLCCWASNSTRVTGTAAPSSLPSRPECLNFCRGNESQMSAWEHRYVTQFRLWNEWLHITEVQGTPRFACQCLQHVSCISALTWTSLLIWPRFCLSVYNSLKATPGSSLINEFAVLVSNWSPSFTRLGCKMMVHAFVMGNNLAFNLN